MHLYNMFTHKKLLIIIFTPLPQFGEKKRKGSTHTLVGTHTHILCMKQQECSHMSLRVVKLEYPLHNKHGLNSPLQSHTPPSSIVVNMQGRESGGSCQLPGSRLARVCGTPGCALVVWPLTPWLI